MRELNSQKKGQIIPFMKDGSYFYKKGIEAYKNHQLDQGINYIERAIQMEPEEPVFLCQLAIILSEKGNFEEANKWLEKVLSEVDDSMAECYFFMANNLAHMGHFDMAITHLKKYIEMDPEGEFVEDAHSLMFILEEEDLELGEDFEYTLKPTPLDSIVDLLNKGNYDGAEKEARGYLLEKPKEWDVYAYLAESLMYQGELDQAKKILQDLLLKEEPNFLAQCLMTTLLFLEGNPDKEIWSKNLKNLRPMKDWHCYYLAKTLFFSGEYSIAYKWYQKLYRGSDFRKTPPYFHQMAIAAWKNGNRTKAKYLWEKTRSIDHENEEIASEYLKVLSAAKDGVIPEDGWFIYSAPSLVAKPIE
ncbi:tetratricopeptide repeat protein [Evansella tamaricis]|uniref:Tetratricopeptide repeat protein n=1 Tax=Evansella tamaricis TaxID=2069301 RepID=A0ABS6JIT7_9BACI|nr:tetratricopeptide repeat protein [Evansella tamaricis]MBU9712762.1 tetratricopeptide repeat protein [Evansella tamaricis]